MFLVHPRYLTVLQAGEVQGDNQQNKGDGMNPNNPHPSWSAGNEYRLARQRDLDVLTRRRISLR